jgi:hypothetical protein
MRTVYALDVQRLATIVNIHGSNLYCEQKVTILNPYNQDMGGSFYRQIVMSVLVAVKPPSICRSLGKYIFRSRVKQYDEKKGTCVIIKWSLFAPIL